MLLDIGQFRPILAAVDGGPPEDGNAMSRSFFVDVGVELIREDPHDTVGNLPKTGGSQKEHNGAYRKKGEDVSAQDDAVETRVCRVDIIAELV